MADTVRIILLPSQNKNLTPTSTPPDNSLIDSSPTLPNPILTPTAVTSGSSTCKMYFEKPQSISGTRDSDRSRNHFQRSSVPRTKMEGPKSKSEEVSKNTIMRQKRVHSMRGMTKAEADRYRASSSLLSIAFTIGTIFTIASAFVNQIYYGGTGLFEGLMGTVYFMITVFVSLLFW